MTCSVPTRFEGSARSRPACLLLTGCYRSGTTLLEKLLHNHPDVCLASQPFAVLYFHAKQAFLAARGLQRRYPLDHLFLETDYTCRDFSQFLAGRRLSGEDLDEVFDRLAEYRRGLWTPQALALRDRVEPGSFLEVFRQLNVLVASLLGKPAAAVVGSKEILCEEYLHFLLSCGEKAILILRDPRDMITSLSFRERDNLTGDHRPLLYSLRLWRKSVAFALALEHEAGFHWLRYEDLVTRPGPTLQAVTALLEVQEFAEDAFRRGIRGQDGAPWRGNSSFADHQGISRSSKGAFLRRLPDRMLAYIEGLCGPEMEAMGYELVGSGRVDEQMLAGFREPCRRIHEKFPADYARHPERVRAELERLALLRNRDELTDPAEIRKWFLHERAYRRLAAAASAAGNQPVEADAAAS